MGTGEGVQTAATYRARPHRWDIVEVEEVAVSISFKLFTLPKLLTTKQQNNPSR
jgi:hypothetical protein